MLAKTKTLEQAMSDDNDELVVIDHNTVKNKPIIFELRIEDHIPWIDPNDYGLDDYNTLPKFCVDPNRYFITSGDAIKKTEILRRDYWEVAKNVRKLLVEQLSKEHDTTYGLAWQLYNDNIPSKKYPKFREYSNVVWKTAGQCDKLLQLLIEARGEDIFLETEWDNHILRCCRKNPRNK